jgi:hypothetical protein
MYLKPTAVKRVVDLNPVDTSHVRIPINFQGIRLIFKFTLKFDLFYHTALHARSFGRPRRRLKWRVLKCPAEFHNHVRERTL